MRHHTDVNSDAAAAAVKSALTARQREVRLDVRERIRSGREAGFDHGRDMLEDSEANTQGDMDRALLELRAATLVRMDAALRRLDGGQYGDCAECGRPIAEKRLHALPFAIRCRPCEERRETVRTADEAEP